MLSTTVKREEGMITVALEGKLDALTAIDFSKELEELLTDAPALTLDVEKVEYISSAGLRTILEAQQYMESKNLPDVKVINVKGEVAEIFAITGFDNLVDTDL